MTISDDDKGRLASEKPFHADDMLRAMRCIVSPNSATYISGPITTGKNFLKWYSEVGRNLSSEDPQYKINLRRDVMSLNEGAIYTIANRYRERGCRSVIEPASLYIPAWGQADYISFWIDVIDYFVAEVVFADGWQFSAGCVAEFEFAAKKGCELRAHDGSSISINEGEKLIADAVCSIDAISSGDLILSRLADNLRKVNLGFEV